MSERCFHHNNPVEMKRVIAENQRIAYEKLLEEQKAAGVVSNHSHFVPTLINLGGIGLSGLTGITELQVDQNRLQAQVNLKASMPSPGNQYPGPGSYPDGQNGDRGVESGVIGGLCFFAAVGIGVGVAIARQRRRK